MLAATMDVLRVATLNVWNRSGPWAERLALIREGIAGLDADVIGLQEVMRLVRPGTLEPISPEHDQAAEIAKGFDYEIGYAAASDYGNGLIMGNAVLSRFPLYETRTFRLPDQGTGERRALLYALAGAPWGRLPLFVTHLNWRFDHGFVRLKQVAFITERVSEVAPIQAGFLPPVLMGDFNAEPSSDEIRYFSGLHVLEGRSVHFADAWIYGSDGSAGATYDPQNDYARKNREPPRRIDYIFARGPDAELRGEPLHARLCFHEPAESANGTLWPSDHFGVYAEIMMEPRSL
jgi:endonuclease/exonuclease/phosphatase family metal-dependent hydrolase